MKIQHIQQKIYEIRGQKVMLDFDLAELYETENRSLKQAVKRNTHRFPPDFMFELTVQELDSLRSQIVILKNAGRGQHSKYLPFAFTEQGVAMLSSVLNSQKAIEVNIAIIRAFVFLRQYALEHRDLKEQLKIMEEKYDKKFEDVYEAIRYLLKKDEEPKERKAIGFKSKTK